MRQLQALLAASIFSANGMFIHLNQPQFNPLIHNFPASSLSSKFPTITKNYNYLPPKTKSGFCLFCNLSDSDSISQLELSKQYGRSKPEKKGLAIFGIILLNLAIYVADHIFLDDKIKALYLFHNRPAWYQFVTAAFYHANWNHLSSNLFFLYHYGKLVEEEEGSFALWLSYILIGAGTNLVSWLVLPKNAITVGASGAVFGLFAISVLVKMSWRKFFEVLIGGPFVIAKVIEAARASTTLSNGFIGSFLVQSVNHTVHLSGALVGVLVLGLLRIIPSDLLEKGLSEKTDI